MCESNLDTCIILGINGCAMLLYSNCKKGTLLITCHNVMIILLLLLLFNTHIAVNISVTVYYRSIVTL